MFRECHLHTALLSSIYGAYLLIHTPKKEKRKRKKGNYLGGQGGRSGSLMFSDKI